MSNQICDTIFVMDPQFNVIGILSNNGAFPNAPFFDDIYTQELATGAETYEFSTFSNAITSEILQLGNYIVFKYGDKYKLFQIMDDGDEHKENQTITCYCEMAGLELLTDYCEPFSIEGNVELFFNTVLQDTNWSLGGYSSSLVTNIQQVKNEKYANVYKLIQDNIETYGNIEIEFRVGFNGNTVTGFYIDVYENGYRGSKTYKRFEYGENVEGIKRNRNMYDFASAMIGTGKDGLTFKDIEWKKSEGKPADKPKGQDFIVDLKANDRFNKRGRYIKGLYESDDTNPQDLLLHSWEKLQEVKEPKFDYEVDLALTDTEFEEISIGDTNYVIDNDYNPPILLECRVGKLEISLTDSSKNKCTLSNYKEIASKIREPKDGENGKTPEIGDNGNWWINGTDTNKPSQGLPGANGEPAKYIIVNGEQVYKYANGFEGSPTPSVITITSTAFGMNVASRTWSYKTPAMSDYVNMSSTDANIVIMHNDVIWGGDKSITVRCSVGDKYDEITLVKVADGEQGDSAYTIVLSNENHSFPCQSNGNIPSAITTTTRVIAFKGTKEIAPTVGTLPTIPGLTLNKSGATITIVANTGTSLADSGTFDIPLTVEGVSFIKSFTWAKSKAGGTGPQGNPGTDGKTGQGIESVDVEYAKSMNSVTPPGPGWSTIIPSYEKGYFLWQRTKVVYKDPAKTVYTTPIVDTTWSEIDSVYHSIGVVDGRICLLIGNSQDETSLTLTPQMMTLLSENLVLSGKNIEINGDTKITGLVTANENFKINSDGSMSCKKATIEGAITATGNIVLYDNPKGFRGKDTAGNEITLSHVGMDDCSRFGWGSWERMSAAAYNMGCEYLGGKRAMLRSKEQTFLVCNGGTYDAVGGSSLVFLMNSAGDYAFRPVAPNKDYLGTGTYYWAGVSSKEFNNTSDRNLKENVKYLSNAENIDINSNISALDCYDFMKNDLPVALYNYIDDFRTKIGVIAQDIVYNADNSNNKVGQLIVNMIPYEENNVGAKLTYDMNNFIGVIVAAQQVNIKKTEGHDERLNKIEKRLELLENGK